VLESDETDESLFHLDVPTDPNCAGPDSATDVWFVADGNAESVHDRGNNTVHIVVDQGYWRPDYAIRNVTWATTVLSPIVIFSVRNVGPTRASHGTTVSRSHARVLDDREEVVFSSWTPDLAPGSERSYHSRTRVPLEPRSPP
jgi:hypothetical protein